IARIPAIAITRRVPAINRRRIVLGILTLILLAARPRLAILLHLAAGVFRPGVRLRRIARQIRRLAIRRLAEFSRLMIRRNARAVAVVVRRVALAVLRRSRSLARARHLPRPRHNRRAALRLPLRRRRLLMLAALRDLVALGSRELERPA